MKQPPNSAYWKKRFRAIEQQANVTGANSLNYIVEQYRQAMQEIEAQLAKWYVRFARNNDINLHEAKKQLSGNALKEFQWTVREYIQYGEENALNGAWMKQLENASAKRHITRLDALKLQNQAAIEALFGKQEQSLTRALRKVYPTSYYHTCYEVQKAFEIGWDIASVDEKKLAAALSTPWTLDGGTFSDRLWNNKQKLIQTTQSALTRGILTGKKPDELINEMQSKMNASRSNAGRLVMTETAAISAMGQKDAFQDLGVEEFEIVETLDNKTCEVCAEMDGQHFPMSEYAVGVTAPPFHPWCRGCTCPHFHDEFTADSQRIARTADGEQYYVPGDTMYQEWKKAFVNDKQLTLSSGSANIGDGDEYTTIDKIEDIDFNDKKQINRAIEQFCSDYALAPLEHSLAMTPEGKAYYFVGTKGTVDPSIIGIEKLKDSITVHNHPVKAKDKMGDSFSQDDLRFAARCKNRAGFLISGERRNAFIFTRQFTEDKIDLAWEQAKSIMLERSFNGELNIDWEQEEILKVLNEQLEGFEFYENF